MSSEASPGLSAGLPAPLAGVPRIQHDQLQPYFIKSWLICGPFVDPSGRRRNGADLREGVRFDYDYIAAAGGEAEARPALGMRHPAADDNFVCWERIDSPGDVIDFVARFRPGDNSLAYAYCEIESPTDTDVIVGFGSDDSGKFFVNGELIHSFCGPRGHKTDNDFAKAHLVRGVNRVLVKVDNAGGGWGFSFHVMSAEHMFADPGRYAEGMILTVDIRDVNKGTLRVRLGDDRFKLLGELPPVDFDIDYAERVYAVATETVTMDTTGLTTGLHCVTGRAFDPQGREITREAWIFKGDLNAYYDSLARQASALFAPRSPARVSVDGLLAALRRRPADHPMLGPGIKLVMQMIEDAEAGIDPLSHKIGPRLGGYWSPIDGTQRWYPFYVPKSYTPEKPAPLLVLLHGYDVGNKDLLDGYWENAFRPPGIAEEKGVIVMFGFGRGNTDYWGIGRDDVLRGIEGIQRHYNVDANRIYVAGGSMGGTGTWNIGVRDADRFAALAPDFGRADFRSWLSPEALAALRPDQVFREERWAPTYCMDNLLHVPCIVNHGEKDPIVVVGHSRAAVAWIKRIGGNVVYKEHAGKEHGGLGNEGESQRWMLQFARDPKPKRVRLRSGWLKQAKLYWVHVDAFEDLMKFAQVDVEITGKKEITLKSENVAAITLIPPRELIELSPPLKLRWNDKVYPIRAAGEIRADKAAASDKPILVEIADQALALKTRPLLPGLRKTDTMEGPMDDVYCGPFAFVRGTNSDDPFTREVIAREITKMVEDWAMWQHAEPRVMDDTDVTDYEIGRYNLILVGGPDANSVTKRVMEPGNGFPLRIEGNSLLLGDAKFAGDDLGVAMCYPNPLNPRRYVLVLAGTSWKGVYQLDAFKNKDYDYFVVDDRSQCHPPYDDVVLVQGYFDDRWQFNRRYAWERKPEVTRRIQYRRSYPKYLLAQDCADRLVYLSDVVPTMAKGDLSRAGHDLNWFQQPIQLGAMQFTKGLSTKVEIGIYRNDIFYDLDRQFDRFQATVGLEIKPDTKLSDLQRRETGLVFYVLGDGRELYKSSPIGPDDRPVDIDVDIRGVKELWLKTFNKGAWHVKIDSADWGAARVVREP